MTYVLCSASIDHRQSIDGLIAIADELLSGKLSRPGFWLAEDGDPQFTEVCPAPFDKRTIEATHDGRILIRTIKERA